MFQIGDKVECIMPIDNLKRGKVYTVVGFEAAGGQNYDNDMVIIEVSGRHNGWYASRFRLALNGIERARRIICASK